MINFEQPKFQELMRYDIIEFQINTNAGYTANTMSADALATIEDRASAVMFLIPKLDYFDLLQHQKS